MIAYRIVERKRDGERLGSQELRDLLEGYLRGDVPDYQMAAFLMAVVFRGLDDEELDVLVDVMIRSGATLDFPEAEGPVVDKHSTGGVGDKVSLVLSPLAAELGMVVPMMSGRGLGHTGGTLDKLESIPGFRTDLSLDRFRRVLGELRCAMIGQTEEIAPLDRRLYDLRSVTGTVPSVPLIAASIMSKKLAEGLDALVLDVKTGNGAFLAAVEGARELAETMVRLGERRGVRTGALLTAMDRPLGRAVGNALEVREALACLAGGGPSDLRAVTVALVAEMLALGGLEGDANSAGGRVEACLDSGRPLERFRRLVELQGGDSSVVEDPNRLPGAPEVATVEAPREGVVERIDTRSLGHGVVEMGGGRKSLGEAIDPRVGLLIDVRPGHAVARGEPLAEVHASDAAGLGRGREVVLGAVQIGDGPPADPRPLVGERIRRSG